MSPSTGYGLHFVISLHAFDVMTFEKPVIFEAYHSKKFRRYEKNEGHIHKYELSGFRHKTLLKPFNTKCQKRQFLTIL